MGASSLLYLTGNNRTKLEVTQYKDEYDSSEGTKMKGFILRSTLAAILHDEAGMHRAEADLDHLNRFYPR